MSASVAETAGEFVRELPEWFARAKLGVFIHWGAYSVPAWAESVVENGTVSDEAYFPHNPYAEWYWNTMSIEGSPAAEWHRKEHGGAPYDDFLDAWRAEEFDPEEWAALFARAGADYVIPTAKHHDGITLWNAPGTGGRNTVARGPQRDLVGDLAGAVRHAGMRFGVYYSGGIDWHVLPPRPILTHPELYASRPMDAAYHRYATAHVRDLIRRFRPDVLWNDIDWPDAGKTPGPDGVDGLFRHYYEQVPDGVVNDRWGVRHADFLTSEYESLRDRETAGKPWEHTRGLGLSFGHNRAEDPASMLSAGGLARHWVDVVARGGRLLINVGPTASGRIPDEQREALEGFGAWRAALGDAPAEVIAWADPADAFGPGGGPWLRFWNTAEAVIVFVGDPGAHDIRLPNGATLSVVIDTVAECPVILSVPKEATR
ncbi:alpha-L-fucosidase [Agromyces cerinus]|uniref:alpha-L-fucosidase n=1 Tax=Agromyces cerinus subsp. cerinus TaxID=232089 RepID=A0A1N6IA18_9MICO|nr:alpha-L-fucosidase [Agromyces cerinus]SIO28856.1 alpha-L-fucosidase [Agromyces cerinus subsp. cerinus]